MSAHRYWLEGIVSSLNVECFKNDSECKIKINFFSKEMYVKMALESKACSPVIQILRNYPISCCLLSFTYLKTIAETLPFYQCQPALFISGCHFVITDWFKGVMVM